MAASKGSAGGAKLATGFIELSVRYAGAMGQIASDFDAIDTRAKRTGESISKNLVEGADKAKAQVAQLSSAYDEQRAKVEQLKASMQGMQQLRERAAAAEKAYLSAFQADGERRRSFIQQEIALNEQLNRVRAAARAKGVAAEQIENTAEVKAVQAQINANNNKRKEDLKDLTRLEKELQAARSASGDGGAAAMKVLNAEVAKGTVLYEQLTRAVEDSARKQELAAKTAASLGSANQHISIGMRMAKLIAGPFAPELYSAGTKAGNAFRQAFGRQMDAARGESQHHARNIASGLLMGLTPMTLSAAGVGLAIGAAFTAGFNRNEVLNTTRLRLLALGKTQAEVASLTKTAEDSVVGTQYSLQAAMEAATGAMAANIALGPKMVQHMDNIANAAALSGQPYEVVAEAINRVQRLGTVSLENLEPLLKAGVPILDWILQYYKKDFPNATLQDITEMISKKMVPADVLEQAMSQHLNNSMKAIGKKTVKGALADLFTQVGKVTGSILEPIMGDIPTFLNSMGDKLKAFAVYIRPGMAAAVAWIKDTWRRLWPYVAAGIDWLRDTWEKLWPKVKEVFNIFADHWKKMWPQLQEKFEPFMRALREAWDSLFPFIKNIGIAVGAVALSIIDHLPAIAQFATNLIHWFSVAMNWLRTQFWPWLKESWKKFTTDVGDAWRSVKDFSDKVIGFFDKIKSGTAATWQWLEDKFNWLKEHVPGVSALLSALGLSGPQVALTSSSTALPSGGVKLGAPGSYGLPAGANSNGYGGGGVQFPQWVYDFGKRFNLQPSTYPGHQERGGVNHGIDWVGKPEDLQRAAEFLAANGAADQVIYANPNTGQKTGYAAGYGRVGPGTNQPQYYAGDWAAHGNHMHTSFSRSMEVVPMSLTSPAGSPLWDKIAAKESSGNWGDNNSGNNMTSSGAPRGGLQITDGTWKAYGGLQFAPTAAQATKEQQIEVAKRIAFTGWNGVAPQGLGAWQVVTEGKVAGVTPSMSASDFGGINNLSSSSALITPDLITNGGAAPVNPLYAPLIGSIPEAIPTMLTTPAASSNPFPDMPNPNRPVQPLPPGMSPDQLPPGMLGGGGDFNSAPPMSFWDKYINPDPLMPQWMKEVLKPRTISILPDTEMPGANIADAFYNATGMPYSTLQPRTIDSGAGHDAASQRMHRGINGPLGPKGTRDDPIVTTDPQVADNTDPNNPANQPPTTGPGAPGQPGAGSAAGQGLGAGGASDTTVYDQNGNPIGDLASGMGDVASKAFSDQFAGTPFSDPTTWPNVQSAGALLQFFGGLLRGQGGSGLGGLFGGGGGKPATAKQLREAGQAIDDKRAARDAQAAKVASMQGKPQYTAQEIADEQAKLDRMNRDLGDLQTDQAALQARGVRQNPFTSLLPGSPGPAPGGDINGGAITPGGGWAGSGGIPTGLIPNPADLQPGQQPTGGGPQVNIDMSTNQQIQGDPVQAADMANRATATKLRSSLLQNNIPPPTGG